ncbi:MAG: fibronectin type III domain-containing protein, partial [Candidatus Aquicultorales bacterium]
MNIQRSKGWRRTRRLTAILLAAVILSIGIPMTGLGAETVLFSSGFESGTPAGMTLGNYPNSLPFGNTNPVSTTTWGVVTTSAHAGAKALWCAGTGGAGWYSNNMNAYARVSVNLTNYSNARVSFWYKVPGIPYSGDVGSLRITEGGDMETVEVPWIATYPPAPEWTYVNYTIPSRFLGKSNVQFEFSWVSDQSVTDIGAYIDDMVIAGTGPDTTVPTNPSNLSVSRSGSNLNLTWTASTDAGGNLSGYKVERSSDGLTGWSQIGTTGAGVTTYSDTVGTIDYNKNRYYRVRAYDGEGNNSGYSNVASGIIDTQAPSVP